MLKKLEQLKNLEYGQPEPRHGLKLLHWFTKNCLSFNHRRMILKCDPENGDFGFHRYKNRYDRNGVKLLPDEGIPYYVVGNLSYAGADELPDYVREDYTGLMDDSNMDRIIVSVDNKRSVKRVYVTEHDDLINYNPNATYCISKGLLKAIRPLDLEDFLGQAGYLGHSDRQPVNTHVASLILKVNPQKNWKYQRVNDTERNVNGRPTSRNTCCECTIL